MSDVFLFQTVNEGDVVFENGDLRMSTGLQTVVYLSLFGGNSDDSGQDVTTFDWWGNYGETDTARQYRSETQYILRNTSPLTSADLLRVEDAAKRDLQWLIDDGEVTEIAAEASVPTVNTLRLEIQLDGVKLVFLEGING